MMDDAYFTTSSVLIVYTHTQTHTRAPLLLIDVLHWSVVLFPSLVPLRLLLFIMWSFPLLAPSNESVTPPRTHLSNHVVVMAQPRSQHAHAHTNVPLRSICHHVPVSIRIVCRSSALHPLFIWPPPSPPAVSLWQPCHCV